MSTGKANTLDLTSQQTCVTTTNNLSKSCAPPPFSWEKHRRASENNNIYLFFRIKWSWCWPASAHRGWNGQKEASSISCWPFESWKLCRHTQGKQSKDDHMINNKKYVNTTSRCMEPGCREIKGIQRKDEKKKKLWLTCKWSFSSCIFARSVLVSGYFVPLESEDSLCKSAGGSHSFHTSVKTDDEVFDNNLKRTEMWFL